MRTDAHIEKVVTNNALHGGFIKNIITDNHFNSSINIAVAFFTDYETILKLAKTNSVNIIVRLGYPTSCYALSKIMDVQNVNVRFFTNESFNPKIYIFQKYAVVGSANLTDKALMTNQEIAIIIDSNTKEYERLASVFMEYWTQAVPMTPHIVDTYGTIIRNIRATDKKVFSDIMRTIGNFSFSNIARRKSVLPEKKLQLRAFRKNYQNCRNALENLEYIYKCYGKKKMDETIPLKIEMETFTGWIRDYKAQGDSWRRPVKTSARKKEILNLMAEWHEQDYEGIGVYENTYPVIMGTFATVADIQEASMDRILDALCRLHSFEEKKRFFTGGLDNLREAFGKANPLEKTRATFSYLLFGSGAPEERIFDVIHDPRYRLDYFEKESIQELAGWVLPECRIINGRTTKSLHYLGYPVAQIDET